MPKNKHTQNMLSNKNPFVHVWSCAWYSSLKQQATDDEEKSNADEKLLEGRGDSRHFQYTRHEKWWRKKRKIDRREKNIAYTHNILEQQLPNQQQHKQQCRRKKEKRVEIIWICRRESKGTEKNIQSLISFCLWNVLIEVEVHWVMCQLCF